MGLENLKSVFSKIEKMDRTDLSKMKSEFRNAPRHPEPPSNDGFYNPEKLSGKTSEFQNAPRHTEPPSNDGFYNPGMPKTSEFQSGPLGLVNNGNDGVYNPENLFDLDIGPFGTISDSDYQTINTTADSQLANLDTPILNEFRKFNFVDAESEPVYNSFEYRVYDPRTARPRTNITKNAYPGTKFTKFNFTGGGEDGIGGIFNSPGVGEKYSLAFRTIQTPQREEIITAGNYGQGHGIIATEAMTAFLASQEQEIKRYYEDGTINTANSSWYSGGTPDWVMPPNQQVSFEANANQTRTVSIDGTKLMANELLDTGGWEKLYNKNGSSKGVGYSYPNADQSKLRYGATNTGFRGDEPYIRRDIGESKLASRDFPFNRGGEDVQRFIDFTTTNAGGMFFLKQNLLGVMANQTPAKFRKLYNPLGTIASILGAGVTMGGGVMPPGIELHRNELFDLISPDTNLYATDYTTYLSNRKQHHPQGTKKDKGGNKTAEKVDWSGNHVNKSLYNDKMTTVGHSSRFVPDEDLESEHYGMPMYFKDLRSQNLIYFRAFLEGLTENFSPTWDTNMYQGNSQPTYQYQRTERDISFTLKMYAGNFDEYLAMYSKLNQLQKLVYPEYRVDNVSYVHKLRQRPPFCEIRIGEFIGKKSQGQLGFLKSLNITVPESSTWETMPGVRRPKHITAAISFQCIARGQPSMMYNRW